MNSSKTKILVYGREPTINTNIYLGIRSIVQVFKFKYLNSLKMVARRITQKIKYKTRQANVVFIK